MTRNEFLIMLENVKHRFKWEISSGYAIRGWQCDSCYCPITAVNWVLNKKFFPYIQVDTAADMLGLNADLADLIVCAADAVINWRGEKYDKELRDELRSIVGL